MQYYIMIVTFEKDYLRDLYTEGRTRDKKHRFQPDIIRRYQKGVRYLMDASSVEALYRVHSLNYEVLSGDKEGISSIRVNDQYRIEFVVSETADEPIVTICNVINLSNHYK